MADPSRFEEFEEFPNKKGFFVKNIGFFYDQYQGWIDENNIYYNQDGKVSKKPANSDARPPKKEEDLLSFEVDYDDEDYDEDLAEFGISKKALKDPSYNDDEEEDDEYLNDGHFQKKEKNYGGNKQNKKDFNQSNKAYQQHNKPYLDQPEKKNNYQKYNNRQDSEVVTFSRNKQAQGDIQQTIPQQPQQTQQQNIPKPKTEEEPKKNQVVAQIIPVQQTINTPAKQPESSNKPKSSNKDPILEMFDTFKSKPMLQVAKSSLNLGQFREYIEKVGGKEYLLPEKIMETIFIKIKKSPAKSYMIELYKILKNLNQEVNLIADTTK